MDRSKIDAKYKWDLNSIYSDKKDYDADIKKCEKLVEEELKYKGHILDSSDNLLKILDLEVELDRLFSKLDVFVGLNLNLDNRSSKWSSEEGKLLDKYSELSAKTSFISTELAKLDEELLNKYLKENKELAKYKFELEKIIKQSKHVLSLESEELLSKLGPVIDNGSDVFDKLDNADITLGDVKDSKGKTYKLTAGSYREFIGSQDRTLRKETCYKMHEYYKNHANSIGECLSTHIKSDAVLAKIRHYDSSLQRSLSYDDLTPEFYDKFINDVHKNIGFLHRMMDVYKKALNVDEMHIYDINARIGNVPLKKYSIEEIEETIKNALKIMGDDYMKVVDEAFANNWIDYYETPGKTSGAFSSGCYDTKPYILLNYTGGFDDMETLVHELGHSVHSYYSKKNRSPIDYQYPIFLAEIASTTHEILLNNYLLNNTDDKEIKKYILNNILSNYKSTVYRQVEFAEFEKIVHERTEKGEKLTKDDFTDIYMNLQKFYYGENVIEDDIIKYECLRIPHFYTSFYVYKYGTSMCLAYRFAEDIINKKDGAVYNYIKFISSGGKDYPLNILKSCGIDLEKEDLMDYSLNIMNKYLDEFEKLI